MKLLLIAVLALSSSWASAQAVRDYSLMGHRIFIDALRAGNHDDSGINEYYFVLQLTAVRNSKDDLVNDLDKRPQLKRSRKEFGSISVPVLSKWVPEDGKAEEGLYVDVSGDDMRSDVAAAMREFNAKESEIALTGTIELWERDKLWGFFGEDQRIGSVTYFPIPASEYHAAARTNLKLEITDDKGTVVSVKVRYESPRSRSAGEKSIAPPSGANRDQKPPIE